MIGHIVKLLCFRLQQCARSRACSRNCRHTDSGLVWLQQRSAARSSQLRLNTELEAFVCSLFHGCTLCLKSAREINHLRIGCTAVRFRDGCGGCCGRAQQRHGQQRHGHSCYHDHPWPGARPCSSASSCGCRSGHRGSCQATRGWRTPLCCVLEGMSGKIGGTGHTFDRGDKEEHSQAVSIFVRGLWVERQRGEVISP